MLVLSVSGAPYSSLCHVGTLGGRCPILVTLSCWHSGWAVLHTLHFVMLVLWVGDAPYSSSCHTCTTLQTIKHLCSRFKTPLQLRKHQTVHTGAKPHQCDVCGRQFRERGTLREHHRIHTGAMPFTCEFCGKAFRFKGILTVGNIAFSSISVGFSHRLTKHVVVYTRVAGLQLIGPRVDLLMAPFPNLKLWVLMYPLTPSQLARPCLSSAPDLVSTGAQPSLHQTHRRQHTGERPYSCLECQHHFTNWPNYNKHMKRRHGINTSHQPDPNKLALANMANLQQQQQQQPQQHHHHSVATTPDHLGPDLSLYEDDRERGPASSTHFYDGSRGSSQRGGVHECPFERLLHVGLL
uniref:C2H2-type domain-containing protein n=1 Tax=Timema genevievae TaxID=629358 RepID=A0A7R9JNP7_TIMGE|nr:unnamed protein product [Timema genevievae]